MEPAGRTLIILAGGDSRRMGTPKHRLVVRGESLLDRVYARLRAGFDEVLVSSREGEITVSGARAVRDLHPGAGPLSALAGALPQARNEAVFVVGCDMPYISIETAERLLRLLAGYDAVIPILGGRPEPLGAAYHSAAGGKLAAAVERGERRAAAVLDVLKVRTVDVAELEQLGIPAARFASINTRADYEELLREPEPALPERDDPPAAL